MTPEQKTLARHALGLPNDAHKSYRNRFFAANDGRAWKEWQEMVGRGLADAHADSPGRTFFALTPAGALAALISGERLCQEDFPGVAT